MDKQSGLTSNQIIELTSAHAIKRGAPIAAIYKDRWKVELFFKAIKQNLKIKAFVGIPKNAVLTQDRADRLFAGGICPIQCESRVVGSTYVESFTAQYV